MDRNEFIVATAILLFGAYCLGLLSHWVVTRLSRVSKAEIGELDAMSEALHQAEEARDLAIEQRQVSEQRMAARIAQTEAELNAAMEGLREARYETQQLQEYISKENMGRG
jgi:prophage endopeptidase